MSKTYQEQHGADHKHPFFGGNKSKTPSMARSQHTPIIFQQPIQSLTIKHLKLSLIYMYKAMQSVANYLLVIVND